MSRKARALLAAEMHRLHDSRREAHVQAGMSSAMLGMPSSGPVILGVSAGAFRWWWSAYTNPGPFLQVSHARRRWGRRGDGKPGSAILWLGCEQALVFEELPGNGAGSDLRVQVVRVADPGDDMRAPHVAELLRLAQAREDNEVLDVLPVSPPCVGGGEVSEPFKLGGMSARV
jgi:hypothetical protein